MLKQRVATAVILAPTVIAAIYFLPIKLFALLAAAAFVLGAREWAGFMTQDRKARTFIMVGFGLLLAASIAVIPVDQVWQFEMLNPVVKLIMMTAALWWLAAFALVMTYPESTRYWHNQPGLKLVFGLFILVPFYWALVAIRSIGLEEDPYEGANLLMMVMAMVWAADIGAYFSGKKFGKRKLAPKVSPGKTIEGLVGGVVWALALTALVAVWVNASILVPLLLVALVTVLVSSLGDLTESMFKRQAGIKDSGTLLPGHGGILDRVDSLTAALPVFLLLYLYVL